MSDFANAVSHYFEAADQVRALEEAARSGHFVTVELHSGTVLLTGEIADHPTIVHAYLFRPLGFGPATAILPSEVKEVTPV